MFWQNSVLLLLFLSLFCEPILFTTSFSFPIWPNMTENCKNETFLKVNEFLENLVHFSRMLFQLECYWRSNIWKNYYKTNALDEWKHKFTLYFFPYMSMKKWKSKYHYTCFFVVPLNFLIQVLGKWCTSKKLDATTSGIHTCFSFNKNLLTFWSHKYKNIP